jgi:hypothetical protein
MPEIGKKICEIYENAKLIACDQNQCRLQTQAGSSTLYQIRILLNLGEIKVQNMHQKLNIIILSHWLKMI